MREGVEVKVCPSADGAETFLLCRWAERREKEKAMHERFSERIEKALQSLGRRTRCPSNETTTGSTPPRGRDRDRGAERPSRWIRARRSRR